MKRNSKFLNLIFILIAGMGNVKQGNWQGILTYFFTMILLGIGLVYVERKYIEQFFQSSQTLCTFALLIYIAFVFFWNGAYLINYEEKDQVFDQGEDIPTNQVRG